MDEFEQNRDMKEKNDIVANWLPRYTGTPLDELRRARLC